MARLFDNPVALIILVLIVVAVFGWKRLPDAARSLGRSTRILKSELDGMQGDSKASKETVKGETTQAPPGAVPGESVPATPPPGQSPPPASQSGQQQPGQPGGPQAS